MARSALKPLFLTLSSHEESQRILWGTWGASMGQHGLPACSQRPLLPVHGQGLLWLFLSVTKQTAWMLGSPVLWTHPHTTLPATHPLYTTLMMLQKVFKNLYKNQLFQLRSCQFCSCNASYKTSVLLVQPKVRMYYY